MKAKIGLKSKINKTFVKNETLIVGKDFLSNRDWILSKSFIQEESFDSILQYDGVRIENCPEEKFEFFEKKINQKELKKIFKTDLILDFNCGEKKENFRCFISEDGKSLNFFKERYIDYFNIKTLQADKKIGINKGTRKGLIIGGLVDWEDSVNEASVLKFIHQNNLV